jgi:hypothetical protein
MAQEVQYHHTKLHDLLATDQWTDELRAEVVNYLYNRCGVIQVIDLAIIAEHEEMAGRVLYAKRERLTDLTHLLTPRQLLAAWEELRARRSS